MPILGDDEGNGTSLKGQLGRLRQIASDCVVSISKMQRIKVVILMSKICFALRPSGFIPSAGPGRAILVLALCLGAGDAAAGGYVAPILELPPVAPALTTGASQGWWLALLPLFLLALAGRGGGGKDGLTPLPPDYGGPCFGEGTLVRLERGWAPVETIAAGERIVTSRGVQTILSVEFWRPVDYRHRPCVVEGVRLSPNHGVAVGEAMVPACQLSAVRSKIDGSRYFHVLVGDHSWLSARSDTDTAVIQAESLCLTADLKLARKFPELVERHASDSVVQGPCGGQGPCSTDCGICHVI